MIDFDILRELGTTNQSIRDLFTAQPGTPLHKFRADWESRIEDRIQSGTTFGLKNYQFYAAADLAWDSTTITKDLVPLDLYAQGKIKFSELVPMLKDLSEETRNQVAKVDPKTKELVGIDMPAFRKVVVNLVRSLITRRTAALSVKYVNLDPFFKYEPLSTGFVAKLRGEALSQRVEMMTNAYNYRHDLVQCIRDMLLYSHVFEFVSGAWDCEHQLRKRTQPEAVSSDSVDQKFESYVSREGVSYRRPHPSRTFWDFAHPASSINSDTGVTFAGYWNVVRAGSVLKNPVYFNRGELSYSRTLSSALTGYPAYWALYYSSQAVNFAGSSATVDVPGLNDREKNVGTLTAEESDVSLHLTEYFERITPKECGLGDYMHPVWVRLVVAGGRTVVYGEILPSTPAIYYGNNVNDNRLLNNSFAHDAIPWMDQMSNMLTNLLHAQQSALIKLILMDVAQVPANIVKEIRDIVSKGAIYNKPKLVEYDSTVARDHGTNPREAVSVAETQAIQDVTQYFRSIMQLLSLAERVLGVSANESGQSEPREISATESQTISNTVNTSLSFLGQGVDEAVDAKKRQIYEALISLGSSRVAVPIVSRFAPQTIEAAGFKVLTDEAEAKLENGPNLGGDPRRVTVLGTKQALVYDYNFSSRDGSERAHNTKAAEVLINLIAQLVQLPNFAQKLGTERLFMLLNEVVRLSGAGVDLKFELEDGESDEVPTGDVATDSKEQIDSAFQQVIKAITDDRAKIAQLEQMIAQFTGAQPAGIPQAGPMAPAA